MAAYSVERKTLDHVLRALQIIFALIVMGTDGYAIHRFHTHTALTHIPEGDFYLYYGVPASWGFLMFCAVWTVLVVALRVLADRSFADRAFTGYICVAVEAVAVLSWLAGFIAVAVKIATDTCSAENSSCSSLTAATVFGAFELMLFFITAALTANLVFNSPRRPKV